MRPIKFAVKVLHTYYYFPLTTPKNREYAHTYMCHLYYFRSFRLNCLQMTKFSLHYFLNQEERK